MKTVPKPIKKKKISDQVLDGLIRQYIRLISGGYCKRCRKWCPVETAHLYRRWRKTTRWDLRNVVPLCKDCHWEIDSDPIKLTSFMYDILSKEDIKDLQRLATMTLKEYPIDREAKKQELKEKIKQLGGQP